MTVLIFILNFNIYAMQSKSYTVKNLVLQSLSNEEQKVSYVYKLDANLVDVGYTIFNSNRYSLYSGIIGLNIGPRENVSTAYAFPNPCNFKNGCNSVIFTRLSVSCEIRIFNIAGEEVITLNKNSNTDKYGWDLKDKSSRYVPSGLYLYYIKDPTGTVKKGKIIIIR